MLKQIENIKTTPIANEITNSFEKANKIVETDEIQKNIYYGKTKREISIIRETLVESWKKEIDNMCIMGDIDSNIPYVYNESTGIYEQLPYTKLRDQITKKLMEIPFTTDADVQSVTNTLYTYYKSKIISQNFKEIIDPQNLFLIFNNGTVFFKVKIHEETGKKELLIEFKKNHFDFANIAILKINQDFRDDLFKTSQDIINHFNSIDNSIFFEWLQLKFPNGDHKIFFVQYIADLLQPFNYSQTALFLWGAGGIGKNVFENILKKNITGNTSALEVEDIAKRFQNTSLIESVINISNEISNKDISSKMFNKCISRENIMFEYKGRDTFMARPLAKWLIFANNPLKIEMTSGVRRRILSLEMNDKRIHEWQGKSISKLDFEKLMVTDQLGFQIAILAGTFLLLAHDLDVKNSYDRLIGEGENAKLEEHNQDQLQDFLQEYLVEDKNSAILTRELTEIFNYLVNETDNPIVAGAKEITIKKLTFELRNNKKYSKNLYKLDNAQRGLKKGTYLFGYKFAMDEDKKVQINNIDKVDQIEFLRNELNKK